MESVTEGIILCLTSEASLSEWEMTDITSRQEGCRGFQTITATLQQWLNNILNIREEMPHMSKQ